MSNYPKEYRLCGKRAVDEVFARGRGGTVFPLRWLVVAEPSEQPGLQTLVGVPKKIFKRAVKRNLLKRRMREAVRLWGGELRAQAVAQGVSVRLALLYTSKLPTEYAIIEAAVKTIMSKIEQRHPERSEGSHVDSL